MARAGRQALALAPALPPRMQGAGAAQARAKLKWRTFYGGREGSLREPPRKPLPAAGAPRVPPRCAAGLSFLSKGSTVQVKKFCQEIKDNKCVPSAQYE